MNDLESLRRSSRRSALLSILGVLIFVSSLLFASRSLYTTNKELEKVKAELKNAADSLKNEKKKVEGLKLDESQLNQYLISLINITQKNQGSGFANIDDINWDNIKRTIVNLPSGKRKLALTIALLTTWKEIPFDLGKNSPKSSFDSPGYIQYILSQVGVNIARSANEPLSVTLMKHCKKVDNPLPGDLLFYKGQVGNFGLFYLCPGDKKGNDITIGTLQGAFPLSIYNTRDMNTLYFPFIGYYRVNYE